MQDAPGGTPLGGLRVLIVEDEFIIALDLWGILADLGCVVLGPAPDVPEALRILDADPPDATLLDLNLNGTRATPVAEALAARGIPFVIVSAYNNPLPEPVLNGVPRIAKPYGRAEIGRALRQLVGR